MTIYNTSYQSHSRSPAHSCVYDPAIARVLVCIFRAFEIVVVEKLNQKLGRLAVIVT